MDALIKDVENYLADILSDRAEHFLVDIRVKPINNIKVFIDGDNGVGIDDLVQYNKSLYHKIEEEGIFPDGDFSLEVSSPGLAEPLKLKRQYKKNKGRFVEVTTVNGEKIEGKLEDVNDSSIIVSEIKGKGKKAETVQHNILLENIKSTHIQIKF